MTITQAMVKNVLGTSYQKLDPGTVEYAKDRVMDTVGALIGGVHSSGVEIMLGVVKGWGGNKESTLLGIGGRVPAASAVLVTGIAARANDFEPAGGPEIAGKKSPGHYSATTVPTALAMAEKLGANGRDIIAALVAGDDLASRIGAAGAAPWDIGWDPAGTCSRFGAAAIAGKLMGLDVGRMTNALGIVLNQIGGTMQSAIDRTHSAQISQGLAGWNGILSAELAAGGFTGPEDPLLGKFGYFHQYCREADMKILTEDLGRKYYADEEFKIFPCCRGNDSAIEAALKIVRVENFTPEDIAVINIDLSPTWNDSFLIQPFRVGAFPQGDAIFNLQYNVANVLLRRDVRLEHFTDQAVADPQIAELTKKIKIDTTAPLKRIAARVSITLKDGRELTAATEVPRGDWKESPLTRDEIRDKFRASAAFSGAISPARVQKALDLLENLEKLENITPLVRALTPAEK